MMRTYRRTSWWRLLSLTVISAGCTLPAHAQDDATDLAKKLANPIASLISVPLQYNYDEFGGANDGGKISRLNIQPVIPFSIGDDWNLITRTIAPLIDQRGFPLDAINESGLGDIVASQFFSPKAPTASGWVWGAGPVLLLPTASDDALGSKKWGIGPTAVALKQTGPWTVGFLGNHVWSVAGDDDRADISATFLQPFASYITKTKTTIGLATESTYDWEAKQWSVPVVLQVAQLFKIGPQILQFTVGAKYWAEAPDDGPDGWGLRAQLTFLFPR